VNTLVSVLRRPDGLHGVVSRRTAAFSPPTPPRELGEPLPPCDPYAEFTVLLEEVPLTLLPCRDELLSAWDALAVVERLDSGALPSVLRLLGETVLDPESACSARLPREPRPREPVRTAAHPRGFQGTKYRPPKRAEPRAFDLRPILCSPAGLGELLQRFAPSLAQLEGQASRGEFARLGDPAANRRDPRTGAWRAATPRRARSLPRAFQRTLLWPLRSGDWAVVRGLVSTFWALGLDQDEALRRCVSQLLAASPGSARTRWADLLARELPERRTHLAELVLESGAAAGLLAGPQGAQADALLEVSRSSCDRVYRHRIHQALTALQRTADLSFLLQGYALANRYQPSARFDRGEEAPVCPEAGVESAVVGFMEHLSECEELWEWERTGFGVTLWTRCLQLPGLARVLRADAWRTLDPKSAYDLCGAVCSLVFHELSQGALQAKWAAVREGTPALLELVRSLPLPHRRKAVRCLSELIWEHDDPADLRAVLRHAEQLLPRVCGPLFSTEVDVHEPLAVLAGPEVDLRAYRTAPERSFRALDRAASRENDARLVACGLRALCAEVPGVAEEGFVSAPTQLMRTAKTLGALAAPHRAKLLGALRREGRLGAELEQLDVRELVSAVDEVGAAAAASLIRRKLRSHVRGTAELSEARVEGHRRRLVAALPQLRLAWIQARALAELGASLGVGAADCRDGRVRHALLIQGGVAEHRRSLRRVIRAYLAGQRDSLARHPVNLAWLSRHPRIERETWLGGIATSRDVPELGRVTLEVERDPLEALRLGTYAGTCLGLGGGHAYSAAAIMLDVNKAVVFARAGKAIVGRQVLAISDDDRLVPFSVYPEVSPELRALFKAFDESFARALGVPLFEAEAGAEPEIELVLAQEWMADYVWDLDVSG